MIKLFLTSAIAAIILGFSISYAHFFKMENIPPEYKAQIKRGVEMKRIYICENFKEVSLKDSNSMITMIESEINDIRERQANRELENEAR